VPELYSGEGFDSDIAAMRALDGQSARCADLITVLLAEISSSENAVWKLVKHESEYRNPSFNCKAINSFLLIGYNISRLRPLFSIANRYRILFAYDNEYDDFYLLGIAQKCQIAIPGSSLSESYYDYQLDHPVTQRIFDEYDLLGLPRLH
jgi:hypothetical protein